MVLDHKVKAPEGSKTLQVFQQVEFEDSSKLELLDEAIILEDSLVGSNAPIDQGSSGASDPQGSVLKTQEIEGAVSDPDLISYWANLEKTTQMDRILPAPLLPMSLAIIALFLVTIFLNT
ncbi:MAG: hypothetical protein NTY51_06675 [Deltaproteobacteria bacterium]|nr:hypothetical protein [Deltaproteobacteria bacterium]